MRCAGSPKWPGSFSLHEGAVGEWVVVRLVRSTYPGGWLLPTCSHAPHNGVHGYITCVTLMTTLNRKDGWQGNRRQPWRAGTPRGKRKGKRFLLSPHLKKTAKEQCNSTGPGEARGKGETREQSKPLNKCFTRQEIFWLTQDSSPLSSVEYFHIH